VLASEKAMYKPLPFRCSYESLSGYLEGFENVQFYKGYFPDSTAGLASDRRFCFVHLDVGLYKSTLDCLEYFYPKMQPGGIMLSHDYSILEGVRQAFTKFLSGKPEYLIELPTTQCMVIKR